jgi:hypothetical protein
MGFRRAVVAFMVFVLAFSPGHGGAAWSQTPPSSLDSVAAALRRSPVYIDPTAERALPEPKAEQLASRIRDKGAPVFVAVLPSSITGQGGANQVLRDLVARTGLSGTYAVVVGESFRATSTSLSNADEIATAAIDAKRDEGTFPVLDEFVRRVASEGRAPGSGGGATPATSASGGSQRDGGGGAGSLLPLVLLAAAAALVLIWSRRRRRHPMSAEHAQLEHAMASDRQMLRAQLSVLSDDVMRLEPQVTLHPEARTDYEAAVERYRIASAAMDYADEPVDMVRVQRVVEEASYAMSRARALTEGRTPPPPPEDLRRPGAREEPALDLDETGMPFYAGGAPFYGGGWFGGGYGGGGYGGGGYGGGGLFGGLLLGSMLGGLGPFGGWAGNHIEINDYGDNDRFGRGDGWGGGDGWGDGIGGGDWGGGGGDWGGGGDVGGGDW